MSLSTHFLSVHVTGTSGHLMSCPDAHSWQSLAAAIQGQLQPTHRVVPKPYLNTQTLVVTLKWVHIDVCFLRSEQWCVPPVLQIDREDVLSYCCHGWELHRTVGLHGGSVRHGAAEGTQTHTSPRLNEAQRFQLIFWSSLVCLLALVEPASFSSAEWRWCWCSVTEEYSHWPDC